MATCFSCYKRSVIERKDDKRGKSSPGENRAREVLPKGGEYRKKGAEKDERPGQEGKDPKQEKTHTAKGRRKKLSQGNYQSRKKGERKQMKEKLCRRGGGKRLKKTFVLKRRERE